MMKNLKPIIKFNGGSPVALCNRCFVIMCRVNCVEDDCAVIEVMGDGKEDYISTPIGRVPPVYCDKCRKLLTYSINE